LRILSEAVLQSKCSACRYAREEFDVSILEDEAITSSRSVEKQLPSDAAPRPRRTETSGVVCTVQLVTMGRGTCSDTYVTCTVRLR
jgi:hypothetical protein